MDCKEIRPLLAAWLDGEVGQERSIVVEGHVASCAGCGSLAAAYRVMQQGLPASEQARPENRQEEAWEEASLWQSVHAQIQAEENAALRSELQTLRQTMRGLQAEVSDLRRQVQRQEQREASHFNVLMPVTLPTSQANSLRSLL